MVLLLYTTTKSIDETFTFNKNIPKSQEVVAQAINTSTGKAEAGE